MDYERWPLVIVVSPWHSPAAQGATIMTTWISSDLFKIAHSALAAAHQDSLRDLFGILTGLRPNDDNAAGRDIRRNVETEQQLSRMPDAFEPEILHAFLTELCGPSCDHTTDDALTLTYKAIAKNYAMKGLPIRSKPTRLLRYNPADGFFGRIANALKNRRSGFGDRLQQLLEAAISGSAGWQRTLNFVQQPEVWQEITRDEILLTREPAMFVTFEDSAPLNRNSTETVWQALALWSPKPSALLEIELELPTDLSKLHYPTVTDAGWYGWFRSAHPTSPHGLTGPRNSTLPPQPEAVLAPLSLSKVSGPECLRILGP